MKNFLEMYRRLAEECSGVMTISVMQVLFIVFISRKMRSGSLDTTDIVIASVFLLFAIVGGALSFLTIWNTIEKIVPTLGKRILLGAAYYPVVFGVLISGFVTAGVVIK